MSKNITDASILTVGSNIIPCLPSWFLYLEQQDYPLGRMEWIIFTTEDNPEGIQKTYSLIEGSPLRVRFFSFPDRTVRQCWDLALQEATGDVIICSIGDVVPAPGWVSGHVNVIKSKGNACVAGIVLPHPKIHPKSVTRWFLPEESAPDPSKENDESAIFSVTIANLSFPREFALKLGGFNKNFIFEEFMEVELVKRLILGGAKFHISEDALVWVWRGNSYLDLCKYHYKRGYSIRTYLNLYPEDYHIQWTYKLLRSFPVRLFYSITFPYYHRICTKFPEDSRNLSRIYTRMFRYWRAKGFWDASSNRFPQIEKFFG